MSLYNEKIEELGVETKMMNEGVNVSLKQIASNLTAVKLGKCTIYFSYETPVAFEKNGTILADGGFYSKTTSKHINMIKPDSRTKDTAEFMYELKASCGVGD